MWNRNYLSFRSTWIYPRFLMGFVLLDLWFSVWCFVYLCLSFCPFLVIVLSVLFWSLCSLSFFGHCAVCPFLVIVLSVLFRFTTYGCPFGIFKLFLLLHLPSNGYSISASGMMFIVSKQMTCSVSNHMTFATYHS